MSYLRAIRADYTIGNYPRFILKRLVRLDPPYLVAVAIALLLLYFSTAYRGAPFAIYEPSGEVSVTISLVLLHLAYLNVFFGGHWLIGVLWTLAIEFQYYLLIGMIFPLLRRFNLMVYISLGLLSALLPSEAFLFHYLFLFMLGILTFQRYVGIVRNAIYIPGFAVLTVGIYFTLGLPILIVSVFAAIAILTIKADWRVLRFFGNISYSLYLVHLPIGLRVLKLSGNKYAVSALALFVSIVAAYLLYRLVELPAQRWASQIAYQASDLKRSTRLSRTISPVDASIAPESPV